MTVELWRTMNPSTDTQSYLHESNWKKHAEKRAEIRAHLQSVRQTVEDPDFALQDDKGVLYKYKKGFGVGALTGLWLVVIEKADAEGSHFVKTMYFTSHVVEHPHIYVARIFQ